MNRNQTRRPRQLSLPKPQPPVEVKTDLCQCCYSQKPDEEVRSMPGCSRKCCKQCLESQIKTRLNMGQEPKCPTCNNEDITWGIAKQVLPEKELVRMEKILLQMALQKIPDLRFCPNPFGCINAMVGDPNCSKMQCDYCTFEFCYHCSMEWHDGLDCKQFKIWKLANNRMFRANETLKTKVCKICPECTKTIEKWDGCNHITCRCGAQFCWVCGAPWDANHYNCVESKSPALKIYVHNEGKSIWNSTAPVKNPPPQPKLKPIPRPPRIAEEAPKEDVKPPKEEKVVAKPVPLEPEVPEGKKEEKRILGPDEWQEVEKKVLKKEKPKKDEKKDPKMMKKRRRNFLKFGMVTDS